MRWIYFNPNPMYNRVGDCTIRALSLAFDQDWDSTYWDIAVEGYILKDMPSSNAVWGELLKNRGFIQYPIQNTCPRCYTVWDFCIDHPKGTYVLHTGTHVVTVKDGYYYDTWDSGDEALLYYFAKETKDGL